MNIWLKEIEINDGREYFNLLNELASYKDTYAKPIPETITYEEYEDYKRAKIKLSLGEYQERVPITTYWVMNEIEPIGYATLRHQADYLSVGGHFGCVLKKEYQNKGIGKIVSGLLSERAYNDLGIKEVIYTSKKENIQSQNSLNKIGAEYVLEKDGYYFYKVNLENILGKGEMKK